MFRCFGGQLVFRLAESCFGGGSENSYFHDEKTLHCWSFGWLNRVLGAGPKIDTPTTKNISLLRFRCFGGQLVVRLAESCFGGGSETVISTTKKHFIIDVSVLWRPVGHSAGWIVFWRRVRKQIFPRPTNLSLLMFRCFGGQLVFRLRFCSLVCLLFGLLDMGAPGVGLRPRRFALFFLCTHVRRSRVAVRRSARVGRRGTAVVVVLFKSVGASTIMKHWLVL